MVVPIAPMTAYTVVVYLHSYISSDDLPRLLIEFLKAEGVDAFSLRWRDSPQGPFSSFRINGEIQADDLAKALATLPGVSSTYTKPPDMPASMSPMSPISAREVAFEVILEQWPRVQDHIDFVEGDYPEEVRIGALTLAVSDSGTVTLRLKELAALDPAKAGVLALRFHQAMLDVLGEATPA